MEASILTHHLGRRFGGSWLEGLEFILSYAFALVSWRPPTFSQLCISHAHLETFISSVGKASLVL